MKSFSSTQFNQQLLNVNMCIPFQLGNSFRSAKLLKRKQIHSFGNAKMTKESIHVFVSIRHFVGEYVSRYPRPLFGFKLEDQHCVFPYHFWWIFYNCFLPFKYIILHIYMCVPIFSIPSTHQTHPIWRFSEAWVKAKAKYAKDLEDFKAAGGVILKPEKRTRRTRATRASWRETSRATMVGDAIRGRREWEMGEA